MGMIKRMTILICLMALSLTIGACSKCDVWGFQPGACHSDGPKPG